MFFSPFNYGEKWVLGSEPCAQHLRTLTRFLIKLRYQFRVERIPHQIDEFIRLPAFLSISNSPSPSTSSSSEPNT